MDDNQLLCAYVEEGSEAAFSELVGKYLNLVHSAAMRQVGGDFHRAKDVAQMVFIGLARQASSLQRHPSLIGWFHTCTYFAAKKLMRAERRRLAREKKADNMNELFVDTDPEVEWDQVRPMLDGVLHELADRDREAILWRFFDAQPLAVVGQKLGVTETAARKRVDRALDAMRSSLVKRGFDSSAAALALMLADHAVVAAPAGLAETITTTALGSAASVGAQASWLLKVLGSVKPAIGAPTAIWLGGILGISAVGVAAHELWSAWHVRAALAQENEDYAARQEQLRTLQQAASHARRLDARAADSAAIRDPKADFQKFLAAYPEAREMILAQHKDLVRKIYGSFFRSADLPAVQIEQFEDVMADYFLQQMTFTSGRLAVDGAPMPSEDKLRAVIGDQAYQELQDYGRTAYAHYLAAKVARESPAAVISIDQQNQLAQILAANNPAPPPAFSVNYFPSLASIDWDSALAQAEALLPAAQWKAAQPTLLHLEAQGLAAKAQQSLDSPAVPAP